MPIRITVRHRSVPRSATPGPVRASPRLAAVVPTKGDVEMIADLPRPLRARSKERSVLALWSLAGGDTEIGCRVCARCSSDLACDAAALCTELQRRETIHGHLGRRVSDRQARRVVTRSGAFCDHEPGPDPGLGSAARGFCRLLLDEFALDHDLDLVADHEPAVIMLKLRPNSLRLIWLLAL